MKLFSFSLLLAAILVAGCASRPDVDELDPMPAVSAEASDPGLANGMLEPPPASPAPVSGDEDLWDRLRQGFALDLDVDNQRIRVQRDWYSRNQAYLDRVATRAERYLHFITAEAEARGVPAELALLPIVESAFDPFAYSHGRAAGPWQFIPSTGEHFGLEQNFWYDGRRDIVASTRAAFEYLERLAERFDGDWLLALASYNAGAGTVARAIRRNERLGRPTDFWHLNLPRETRAYVPKLLAIAQIVKDPAAHDMALQPIADEPYFEAVATGGQIDLAQAAELAGISLEELYLLNPAYNRWATRPQGDDHILVPVNHAGQLHAALEKVPADQRLTWTEYRIRRGDSLNSIAGRFHTTPGVLRGMNRLRGNTIIAGDTLLVPQPSRNAESYSHSEEQRLARSQSRAVAGRQKVDYRVRRGDTLWEIARAHQVGVRELAGWNNMAPGDPLRVNQKLVIWSRNAVSSQPAHPDMIRKVRYAVRRGDSLYRIANRFNVSINEIQNWNGIDRGNYLHPGQRLTLYVDIRNAY